MVAASWVVVAVRAAQAVETSSGMSLEQLGAVGAIFVSLATAAGLIVKARGESATTTSSTMTDLLTASNTDRDVARSERDVAKQERDEALAMARAAQVAVYFEQDKWLDCRARLREIERVVAAAGPSQLAADLRTLLDQQPDDDVGSDEVTP